MPVLYAIKIRKSDLALITLLNNGVTPKIEKKITYFVFEIDEVGATTAVGEIMTERECFQKYEISGHSPLLLRLKK